MITYELAKQLKESGFPQIESGGIEKYEGYVGYGLGYVDDEDIYYPTLSELIEACGKEFESLCKNEDDWRAYATKGSWHPDLKQYCESACCGYQTGSTPEESVAQLWLELNKK